MVDQSEIVGSFLLTGASILVLGVTILLILYKMIDGDFRLIPGICAIFAVGMLFFVVIKPPHPVIPGVALAVVITLVAFFPYAVTMLDKAEMQGIDIEQLEKSYNALAVRPDNVAAAFQFSKGLYQNGFKAHAIAVATQALQNLPNQVDQVGNYSVRDTFRNEEVMLRRWKEEAAQTVQGSQTVRCPSCGTMNEPGPILCSRCGEPYLLYVARQGDSRVGIMNKLLIAWAATAVFFVGFIVIALNFGGLPRMLLLAAAFMGVGLFLARLFRRKDAYQA